MTLSSNMGEEKVVVTQADEQAALDAVFRRSQPYVVGQKANITQLAEDFAHHRQASTAELVEALRKALRFLEGSNPLHASNGFRNCDLRKELTAALSRALGEREQ